MTDNKQPENKSETGNMQKEDTQSVNSGNDYSNIQNKVSHESNSLTNKQDSLIEITAANDIYEIVIKTKSQISSISTQIDDIIEQLESSKKFTAKTISHEIKQPSILPTTPQDNPLELFAMKIEVDAEKLKKSKILSIKNDSVQILKPTALSPAESCYLLLAVNEFVLNKTSLNYDEWKEMCDASNIKSNTPFHKIAGNAKNYGHIKRKNYDTSKEIILEPKGVEIVKKALEKYISQF